ncbi:MAG: hypothetical protein AMS24_00310 [Chlamydiae bacterium SM23_39]|nr:MAG: hypothetical protein AMS24_00310 [Chlamydiae bacterium SM23_39]
MDNINNVFLDKSLNPLDFFRQEYQQLLYALKTKHISVWQFIQTLMARIEDYTDEVKKGWGYATLATEKISSDISDLKSDIDEIKKEKDEKGGVSKETAKKFAEDLKKYNKDVTEFNSKLPELEKYLGKSVISIEKQLFHNKMLINFTHTSLGYIGAILKKFEDTGDTKDLQKALDELAKKDKSGDRGIDKWEKGGEVEKKYWGYLEGLNTVDTVTDNFKTEGQRDLNNFETKINTFNNVAANCMKEMSTFISDAVRNQNAN